MGSNIQNVYTDGESEISLRNQLVNTLAVEDGIRDRLVLEAMRAVPRHWFVPRASQDQAYENFPLSIGHGQTISQPFIVARAAELLRLTGKERVLEVGGGSGYQAAVLALLAGEVFSIEQESDLALKAEHVCGKLELGNVHFRQGDGKLGWPEFAPYDRVLVSCAAIDCEASWKAQLKPAGLLVFPHQVGERQWLERWERGEQGWLQREKILAVKFVPLL